MLLLYNAGLNDIDEPTTLLYDDELTTHVSQVLEPYVLCGSLRVLPCHVIDLFATEFGASKVQPHCTAQLHCLADTTFDSLFFSVTPNGIIAADP